MQDEALQLNRDDDTTDLGHLMLDAVEKARKDYKEITGQDMEHASFHAKSIRDVGKSAEDHTDYFKNYRYNGELPDKIRSFISRNLTLLGTLVNQFSSAATAAFPPAALIFTAFNGLIQAANAESADYDVLEKSLDDVGSDLTSLSMVEGHLGQYRLAQLEDAITDVFVSVVIVFGWSTAYIKNGRFKKGVHAAFFGKDSELKDACDTLKTSMDVLSFRMNSAIFVGVGDSWVITRRMDARQDYSIGMQKTMQADITEIETTQASSIMSHIAMIKTVFTNVPDTREEFLKRERLVVPRTAIWVLHDKEYTSWRDDDEGMKMPYLSVIGIPGTGKSYLAYSVIKDLINRTEPMKRASTAYFFLNQAREEAKSLKTVLADAIIQIAEQDDTYCKNVADILRTSRKSLDEMDIESLWGDFFAVQYPATSRGQLYFVLYGVDVLDKEDRVKIPQFAEIAKKLKIKIILFLSTPLDSISSSRIEVTDVQIGQDIDLFIRHQMTKLKSVMKDLRREIYENLRYSKGEYFRSYTTHSILTCSTSDFTYVNCRLQEIASYTQPKDIRDLLARPSPSFHKILKVWLARIERRITSEKEMESVKVMLCWVAFAKRDLTLQEIRSVISLKTGYGLEYNVREEINDKCGRYETSDQSLAKSN